MQKKIITLLVCLIELFTIHVLVAAADSDINGGKVLIIPLKEQIDKTLLFFLRRAFNQVDDYKIQAIVIDMDTPGGELKATEEIISWIRALAAKDIPVYSYVNSRAQSAGAIICIATDAIFMAPGSRIGSAAPILMAPGGGVQEMPDDIKEKILSDTRALVRGLAQEKGYLPELAVAMVDNSIEFKVGDRVISEEGKLLNLTAEEAIEVIPPMKGPLLAKGIVNDINELLDLQGIKNVELVRIRQHGAEKIARYITMFSPILMTLAFLGIYMELKSPGFGIPGIVGVLCLILFLFGHFIAGLAGEEDIALVLIGMILIVVEIFIFPGFGICGFLGMLSVIAGIVLAMIPHVPSVPDLPDVVFKPAILESYFNQALINIGASIGITIVGMYLLAKYLPKTSLYGQLVLQGAASVEAGYVGTDIEAHSRLIGLSGETVTDLRPAGIARIRGERVDVVSIGDYIEKGQSITVVEVDGPKIVVEAV